MGRKSYGHNDDYCVVTSTEEGSVCGVLVLSTRWRILLNRNYPSEISPNDSLTSESKERGKMIAGKIAPLYKNVPESSPPPPNPSNADPIRPKRQCTHVSISHIGEIELRRGAVSEG